jgi:hypothetical protein
MQLTIRIEPHHVLEIGAFVPRIAQPLSSTATPLLVGELAAPNVTTAAE